MGMSEGILGGPGASQGVLKPLGGSRGPPGLPGACSLLECSQASRGFREPPDATLLVDPPWHGVMFMGL
eukprot:9402794-Pyramimonas_sp.AAC.1